MEESLEYAGISNEVVPYAEYVNVTPLQEALRILPSVLYIVKSFGDTPKDHLSGVGNVPPRFRSLHVGCDYVMDGATPDDAI